MLGKKLFTNQDQIKKKHTTDNLECMKLYQIAGSCAFSEEKFQS